VNSNVNSEGVDYFAMTTVAMKTDVVSNKRAVFRRSVGQSETKRLSLVADVLFTKLRKHSEQSIS
jgi:hypothetical protein